MKMESKNKSYPCSERVCSKCFYVNDCAVNEWCLFDSENKDCPNYEEGMKQFKLFMEDYFGVKHV